ncbi:hypothetical protein NDS46_30435 (plasmid) [Paenibacillus thiaminolyticus]|uniref:hypothetical protein n=1 Tax=Paenibacillus thiaminolyticus TaxID=49283 RepID=UPI00232DF54C|nr:hypothetical protein [Paenibacillus thiaminolyticus]WCF11667.1 hypothetical protein NDS46_30435 [Paenibacillus thiaminolyticus]
MILQFKNKPTVKGLEGLSINNSSFENGKGFIAQDSIIMSIPNTFRFKTNLEIAEAMDGKFNLIMTQFLTRGPEYWDMNEAFGRIGFRDPEIEEQMRSVCNELISRGLASWIEE